jgi:hypothetical protein
VKNPQKEERRKRRREKTTIPSKILGKGYVSAYIAYRSNLGIFMDRMSILSMRTHY